MLELKAWNMYRFFNLKMPSGMHVIVKDVLVITYLYDCCSLCVTLSWFLMCLT